MSRHYIVGDPKADELIDALVEFCGPEPRNRELIREILTTSVKIGREISNRGELKLINSSLKEMRYALKLFCPFEGTRRAVIFGSARTPETDPCYTMAQQTAQALTQAGWMTITGAGGGIMEAGNRGAGPGNSFGVNISLPFEQEANPYIQGDPKLMDFKYFFTRKLTFMKESDATFLFPGGFGTLDETFETLTLVQTGKAEPRPIVMVEPPDGTYWKDWHEFVVNELATKRKLISSSDLALFDIASDVDEAVRLVTRYYATYHSMRFVGPLAVLRLQHTPPPALVEAWNRDFSDMIESGKMETGPCLPEEKERGEFPELPRLFFKFDNNSFARLHQLIKRINEDMNPAET